MKNGLVQFINKDGQYWLKDLSGWFPFQSWLDDELPGYGVSCREPGVVDLGGRGYIPEGQEGAENSP